MSTHQSWNNGPELQFVRKALADLCAEAGSHENPAWWAESIVTDIEKASCDSSLNAVLAANLRSGAMVTRIRSDFDGTGTAHYDAEIHQKMQDLLEEAFAHLKRL